MKFYYKNIYIINGSSMHPYLKNEDIIIVERDDAYEIGDILVFLYKNKLLIHRLLKIDRDRYFCKGDNSFRLEDVTIDYILGKAIMVNGQKIPDFPETLVQMSLLVNKEFRKCKYNIELTKNTGIYRFYRTVMFGEIDNSLIYKINDPYHSIITFYDENIAMHKNTCIFDELCNHIMKILSEECSYNKLISKLYENNMSSVELSDTLIKNKLIELISRGIVEVKRSCDGEDR